MGSGVSRWSMVVVVVVVVVIVVVLWCARAGWRMDEWMMREAGSVGEANGLGFRRVIRDGEL